MQDRPGGQLAKRPLQFFYIIDTSGSMAGRKIESLNLAVRESIQPLRDVAEENPNAEVLIRVLTFSNGAHWHVGLPTPVHDFTWTDVSSDGGNTGTGAALTKLAEALKMENMPARGLPPVAILMTDGMPTDSYDAGLKALLEQPWGQRAVRLGLAIGDDADVESIEKFIANPEIDVLRANSVQDMIRKIKLASTIPVRAASMPTAGGGLQIATPVGGAPVAGGNDVF